jgi:superkiller protein 3
VDEAIPQFQKALEINPNNPEAHQNLGKALLAKGQVDEAIAHFQRALEISPNYPDTHDNLGKALLQKGRVDEAIPQFQKALEINPNYTPAYYNLGRALVQKGRMHEAITCFQQALELDPDNPNILNNLAWLLATCPDASNRNGPKAVQLAQQADQLSKSEDPVMLCTLAAAYAENGQFSEAVASARRALQLATVRNNAVLVNELEAQLGFYQAGSPFRNTHLPAVNR